MPVVLHLFTSIHNQAYFSATDTTLSALCISHVISYGTINGYSTPRPQQIHDSVRLSLDQPARFHL